MAVVSTALPLLLIVLSTTHLLATASHPDRCELCSEENFPIRLKDPTGNISAGQIQVCDSGYWQTVCGHSPNYTFSGTDASVACFQLGFTWGVAGTLGKGCRPQQNTYIAVDKKAPCRAWDEKLSQCLDMVSSHPGCTLQTAVNVTCNGQFTANVVHAVPLS